MSEGYNGYANYETWATGLWIDNDESTYNEVLDAAKHYGSTYENAAYQLSQWAKDFVENMPEIDDVRGQANLAADLLGAALSEVDWYELAEGWLQTAKEAAEYADQ